MVRDEWHTPRQVVLYTHKDSEKIIIRSLSNLKAVSIFEVCGTKICPSVRYIWIY